MRLSASARTVDGEMRALRYAALCMRGGRAFATRRHNSTLRSSHSSLTTARWPSSLRWRKTSPAEAEAAERSMLALIK